MTDEHIKEQLSKAYANVIAANAGIIYRDYANQDYGFDGRFSDVDVNYVNHHGRYSENGYGIDFQLKATTNVLTKNGMIYYDLEVKNYCDLIRTDIGSPRILILYVMPKDREKWLELCPDGTTMRKCAWWCSLRGWAKTNNKDKIRIEIPEKQLLTSEELKRLIDLVKGGDIL